MLICGKPSADFLIIPKLSSSEDLVPLSELESTYNGSPPGENVESQEMNLPLVVRACGNELKIYLSVCLNILILI